MTLPRRTSGLASMNKIAPMNIATLPAWLAYCIRFAGALPKVFRPLLHGLKLSFPTTVEKTVFDYHKEALLMAIGFALCKHEVFRTGPDGCFSRTAAEGQPRL